MSTIFSKRLNLPLEGRNWVTQPKQRSLEEESERRAVDECRQTIYKSRIWDRIFIDWIFVRHRAAAKIFNVIKMIIKPGNSKHRICGNPRKEDCVLKTVKWKIKDITDREWSCACDAVPGFSSNTVLRPTYESLGGLINAPWPRYLAKLDAEAKRRNQQSRRYQC